MRVVLAIASGLVAAACASEGGDACGVPTTFSLGPSEVRGPTMRPGANCLRCHSASGQAAAKPFSFGGAVFAAANADLCDGVSGVTIRITDRTGKAVTVVSNEVGNFWGAAPLTPPFRVSAERDGRTVTMPILAPTGGCALCHSWPDAQSGAAGRIRAP